MTLQGKSVPLQGVAETDASEMGDTSSFDAFYRLHEPQIRRALIAALGPSQGADASASALAYGFQHWNRVAAMANPAGYLYRVGRSSARVRRKPLPAVVPAIDERPGFEPALPLALNKLSSSQRSAVLLVHAWGYPLNEAAALLGMSVSTLRNHLTRGMVRLRHHLGAHTDE